MNMNKNLRLITLLTSLFFLSACQKNIDIFTPEAGSFTGPDTVWRSIITPETAVVALKNDLRLPTVADNFPYNNTGIVYSSGSFALSIPANGLVNSLGVYPSGNIDRQSLLIQKKGDFIAMGMPTVSNRRLMVSGGAFYLGLKNNNDELSVSAGSRLEVRYNSSLRDTGMKVFNGTDDINNGFNWTPTTDAAFNSTTASATGYDVFTNKLQWVHSARILDTVGIGQTFFSLKLPNNYTNANTVAYISFNDMQAVAGLYPNIIARNFVSASLPVNKSITIIVISKQAGDYYLGSQQTTTSAASSGSGTQDIIVTPVKSSLAAIKAYLATL